MKIVRFVVLFAFLALLLVGLAAQSTSAQTGPPTLYGFPNPVPNPNANLGIENDGAFVDISSGLQTLGDPSKVDEVISLSIAVPVSKSEFILSVFDGDNSMSWDRIQFNKVGLQDPVQYRLYADPDLQANTDPANLLGVWHGSNMLDNGWCDLADDPTDNENGFQDCDGSPGFTNATATPQTITQDPSACVEGACFYHFVVDWDLPPTQPEPNPDQSNFIKVASEGRVFLLAGSTIGFQGVKTDTYRCGELGDTCLSTNPIPFDGHFNFTFFVPVDPNAGQEGEPVVIDLYDGDFDLRLDGDDANTPSGPCQSARLDDSLNPPALPRYMTTGTDKILVNAFFHEKLAGCEIEQFNDVTQSWETVAYPPFETPTTTYAEGALSGAPTDDFRIPPFAPIDPFTNEGPIMWRVVAPDGAWTHDNLDVSGNREWELTRFGTEPGHGVDVLVPSLPTGPYTWEIMDADAKNNLFLHSDYNLVPTTGACDLEVTKTCASDLSGSGNTLCRVPQGGGNVTYSFTVTNTADPNDPNSQPFADVELFDTHLGIVADDDPLAAGQSATYEQTVWVSEETENVVTATGYTAGFDYCLDEAVATVIVEEQGGEGCTPGYWKQRQHFFAWEPTGYHTDDRFEEEFGVTRYNRSLLRALGTGGGGKKALGRHAVAALLNSANPDVSYYYSTAQVIAMVQNAFATGDYVGTKDLLATQNEMGCPLGNGK